MSQYYPVAHHVGREETRHDRADPERLRRLAALLDRDWSLDDDLPPLGHFLLFRPGELQSEIGVDGHPRRDDTAILPDAGLPRRMWAGSRIQFLRDIKPSMALLRHSRLSGAVPKSGRSGRMVFCTIEHQIMSKDGRNLLLREEQDIVLREPHRRGKILPRPVTEPQWHPAASRVMLIDPVMLFRYSALTFNAHRIHYDRTYAREQEGYEGLVVHGPYLATLMLDHLLETAQKRRIVEFAFRAISPVFDGEEFAVGASTNGDEARLSIVGPVGLAMVGSARFAA